MVNHEYEWALSLIKCLNTQSSDVTGLPSMVEEVVATSLVSYHPLQAEQPPANKGLTRHGLPVSMGRLKLIVINSTSRLEWCTR